MDEKAKVTIYVKEIEETVECPVCNQHFMTHIYYQYDEKSKKIFSKIECPHCNATIIKIYPKKE